jgi:DNA-binding NarL/FixJ family response regulator
MDGHRGEQPLRILLVDDHALFRRGVRDLLEEQEDMRVVAEAGDGEEALARARDLRPDGLDLVLIDVEMPRLGGIAATRLMRAEHPDLPVVMLTVSRSDDDLFEAARAGAVGFLSKGLAPTALMRALRDFHREGALPMSRTMAARLLVYLQHEIVAAEASRAPSAGAAVGPGGASTTLAVALSEVVGAPTSLEPRVAGGAADGVLTPREREILALIAQHRTNPEIAERLTLSQKTVRNHVSNIFSKLQVVDRAQAIMRAREAGLGHGPV